MSAERQVVVMVASSYPRFPGDGVGSFMEPIAKGVAARGHEVHLVAPWHPAITRGREEDGVHFHFFRYAPVRSMNVFGYAEGLRADTDLKIAAWTAAPLAVAAGWFKAMRVAQKKRATIVHAHWVIPGGVIGALAAGRRPLVVSLHGSDVFVAERSGAIGKAARAVFSRAAWVTACSEDLRTRAVALGAANDRSETIPYGVDTTRFRPRPDERDAVRRELGAGDAPLVFSAGRLVRKKGFEVLIEAATRLAAGGHRVAVRIAGDGDLRGELASLAARSGGVVELVGNRSQDEVARLAAAADLVVVPSVHDEAGNVDGLPNFALEAMATGTPVVASRVGGLPSVLTDGVNGLLVPEKAPDALAAAIQRILSNREQALALGAAARETVVTTLGWPRMAERLEAVYARVGTRRALS